MRRDPDTWWLGFGGVVLLAGAVWFVGGQLSARSLRGELVEPQFTAASVELADEFGQTEFAGIAEWVDPRLQAADPAWTFDVFTPPVIYYNPTTERFSVTPPVAYEADPIEAAPLEPIEATLLGVNQTAFRLQLVGWAADGEDHIGIFIDGESGNNVVARRGHDFGALELELRELDVRLEHLSVPDSMPLRQTIAVAEIWDRRSQRVVRLSSIERRMLDVPVAQLMLGDDTMPRTLRVGEIAAVSGAEFEVLGVTLQPASVSLLRRGSDGSIRTANLSPEFTAPEVANASVGDPFLSTSETRSSVP